MPYKATLEPSDPVGQRLCPRGRGVAPGAKGLPQGHRGFPRIWCCPRGKGVALGIGVATGTLAVPLRLGVAPRGGIWGDPQMV